MVVAVWKMVMHHGHRWYQMGNTGAEMWMGKMAAWSLKEVYLISDERLKPSYTGCIKQRTIIFFLTVSFLALLY